MKLAKGFDCATPLTIALAQQFAAQGYGFVGRYLAQPGADKRLTAEEVKVISVAGLYIVSLFERYAKRACEGATPGTEDGAMALEQAKEVGQPVGSTIYFAVDYDAGLDDYDAIEAYLRAADQQIPGYELGVYGSYIVVEAMRLRGVTTKLMQTSAWSRGQRSEYASLYQYQNDIVVNRIGVDLDESNGDAGGWNLNMLQSQASLPQNIANNIIDSYLDTAWKNCEAKRAEAEKDGRTTDAASWQQLRDWQHSLANELRKASGQPVQ